MNQIKPLLVNSLAWNPPRLSSTFGRFWERAISTCTPSYQDAMTMTTAMGMMVGMANLDSQMRQHRLSQPFTTAERSS
jgi:hypothetical protein